MRGFFGSMLIFVMLILLLLVNINENMFYSELGKAKTLLIEAEQSSKERTILENNTDKIIYEKLKEQVLLKNFLVESIKNEINLSLTKYFHGKANATNFGEKNKEVTISFLNENSKAIMLEQEGLIYAEYTFTGGLNRTASVSKVIGTNITTIFKIPAGHTTKVIG